MDSNLVELASNLVDSILFWYLVFLKLVELCWQHILPWPRAAFVPHQVVPLGSRKSGSQMHGLPG